MSLIYFKILDQIIQETLSEDVAQNQTQGPTVFIFLPHSAPNFTCQLVNTSKNPVGCLVTSEVDPLLLPGQGQLLLQALHLLLVFLHHHHPFFVHGLIDFFPFSLALTFYVVVLVFFLLLLE